MHVYPAYLLVLCDRANITTLRKCLDVEKFVKVREKVVMVEFS